MAQPPSPRINDVDWKGRLKITININVNFDLNLWINQRREHSAYIKEQKLQMLCPHAQILPKPKGWVLLFFKSIIDKNAIMKFSELFDAEDLVERLPDHLMLVWCRSCGATMHINTYRDKCKVFCNDPGIYFKLREELYQYLKKHKLLPESIIDDIEESRKLQREELEDYLNTAKRIFRRHGFSFPPSGKEERDYQEFAKVINDPEWIEFSERHPFDWNSIFENDKT